MLKAQPASQLRSQTLRNISMDHLTEIGRTEIGEMNASVLVNVVEFDMTPRIEGARAPG